jgi:hypothetical protein
LRSFASFAAPKRSCATPSLDVGGGNGHLLRAVLDANPNAKGVLFDLPHVVEQVKASERMTFHPGELLRGSTTCL